jgi:hypothetical protein
MASAFDMSRFEDTRRDPRHAARVKGLLLMYRARSTIQVENVSRSGALVSCDTVPAKGTEVVLSTGPVNVVATVAWTGIDTCGLTFHRAIDPGTLRQLRAH